MLYYAKPIPPLMGLTESAGIAVRLFEDVNFKLMNHSGMSVF